MQAVTFGATLLLVAEIQAEVVKLHVLFRAPFFRGPTAGCRLAEVSSLSERAPALSRSAHRRLIEIEGTPSPLLRWILKCILLSFRPLLSTLTWNGGLIYRFMQHEPD